MKPTMNRVLVLPEIEEKPKKGEEQAAATSLLTGVVKDVGPDVKAIKKNEVVKFAPYGIEEIMVGEEKMLIVDEPLILVHGKK